MTTNTKENWLRCDDCTNRAAGIYLVFKRGEPSGFVKLCGACGLAGYVHKRQTFTPTIKLSLIRSLNTTYREPPPTPERKYNGKSLSELIKPNALKRWGPSSVHPSILNRGD